MFKVTRTLTLWMLAVTAAIVATVQAEPEPAAAGAMGRVLAADARVSVFAREGENGLSQITLASADMGVLVFIKVAADGRVETTFAGDKARYFSSTDLDSNGVVDMRLARQALAQPGPATIELRLGGRWERTTAVIEAPLRYHVGDHAYRFNVASGEWEREV